MNIDFVDGKLTEIAPALLDLLDDQAVVILDQAGVVLYSNRMASQLLRVSQTIKGERLVKVLHAQWRGENRPDLPLSHIDAFFTDSLSSHSKHQMVLSFTTLEADFGQKMWLKLRLRPLRSRQFPEGAMLLLVQDITDSRRQIDLLDHQLAEMADQNKQWQAMYNGVQESIVLLDTKGKVLTVNPATERITGHKANEAIGKHIGELFPKVGVLGTGINYQGRSGLYQTLQTRKPSDLYEAVVETKDKRHIWVNYTYTPLWDSNGKLVALVRVTSDVSTVKAVEQMKNDFVSIASHELRTPLGVINGYLNLFLNGQLGELTADQHTFLERLYHSSTDMVVLVEDLLNVSRIEAGRLEVSVASFNVVDLVQEILDHLQPRYEAKHIKIKIVKPKEPVLLRADQQKVGQALTNLIDNAIKYTYDNGTIMIGIKQKSQAVEVAVKDSGVGIRPENIGHIFEKFYRESNPLSIIEGGSGLGLYISRKLIELHGGSIAVRSKLHEGSVFTVTLPLMTKKH